MNAKKEPTIAASSNAVCNNTKGSYNCTRKPGYEGDGDDCTANLLRNFLILHTIESIAVFIFTFS